MMGAAPCREEGNAHFLLVMGAQRPDLPIREHPTAVIGISVVEEHDETGHRRPAGRSVVVTSTLPRSATCRGLTCTGPRRGGSPGGAPRVGACTTMALATLGIPLVKTVRRARPGGVLSVSDVNLLSLQRDKGSGRRKLVSSLSMRRSWTTG